MENDNEYHNYRISNGNYKDIVESLQRYGLQVGVKCIDTHMCFVVDDIHLIFDWGEWLVIKINKKNENGIKLILTFEFYIVDDKKMHSINQNLNNESEAKNVK